MEGEFQVNCISRIVKRSYVATIPAAMMLLGVAANAQTTVFDSTNGFSSSSSGPIIGMYQPGYGQSFSTGATGSTLTTVTLGLYRGDQTGGTVHVLLYSDSSTRPGTQLDTIGSFSEASLTNTPTLYDFSPASTVTLAAHTRYWVMLSGGTTQVNGHYGALQAYSPDASGVDVSQEFHEVTFGGSAHVLSNSAFNNTGVMKVTVSPFDPVTPEPGSVALLSGLLVSGGVFVRKRRKLRA